ncbi:tryptophan dimethylallyltransferase family protein [Streptomyces noursei]|uniref:tryptophan dimethylallyltransferase family protein n=1 Tax=Streptomyces noursei TaxID=1971 RepID=UPI0021552862|nr:tryptophan dimethylallyltransferase family protein [Streptomyces noursei]
MIQPLSKRRSLRLTQPGPQLGEFVSAQCQRLCEAMGAGSNADLYNELLLEILGTAAGRSLLNPPLAPSAISDDHTPVEFSLAFVPHAAPDVRILVEPGGGTGDYAEDARVGRKVFEALADRWSFSLVHLNQVADVFFPSSSQVPFALGCALALRSTGQPVFKAYLNPAVRGPGRAARVVEEALTRLGYQAAVEPLFRQAARRHPGADSLPFFALDLGNWDAPRAKAYVAHHNIAAADVKAVSRLVPGEHPEAVEEFVHLTLGDGPYYRRPVVSYYSFTGASADRPSGYTVQLPIRDYVRDDQEARDRAAVVFQHYDLDVQALDRALAAMTPRRLNSGVGLMAYLALAYEHDQPPRVTVYLSSQAYHVPPPRTTRPVPA